jgi:hypothetical protein
MRLGGPSARTMWSFSFCWRVRAGSHRLCVAARRVPSHWRSARTSPAEWYRRVQVTAPKSWPNSPKGAEVDYQVAAPAELRAPNLHRAINRS